MKNKNPQALIYLLAIALLAFLSGCNPPATPTQTESPAPRATETLPPTPAYLVPTETVPPTALPTPTPKPTETEPPTPAPLPPPLPIIITPSFPKGTEFVIPEELAIDCTISNSLSVLSWEGNTDRPGNDFMALKTSCNEGETFSVCFASCQQACLGESACEAYTFVGDTQECWLKTGNPSPQAANNMISGVKSCIAENECSDQTITYEPGTDRPGLDYWSGTTNSEWECSDLCLKDSACRAYSFVQSNNMCWLKNSTPAKNTAEGIVSGIKYCQSQ